MPRVRPSGRNQSSELTCPKDRIVVNQAGLHYNCTLQDCSSLDNDDCNSRNLVIMKKWIPTNGPPTQETAVDKALLTIVNNRTLLYTPSAPLDSTGEMHTYCYLNTSVYDMCYLHQHKLTVGEPPPTISDSSLVCKSYDYEVLNCTWCPEGSSSGYNYTWTYKREHDISFTDCRSTKGCYIHGCLVSMDFNQEGFYRGINDITISRKNGYGTTTQQFRREFRANLVVPSLVKGLRLIGAERYSATIGWHCPSTALGIVNMYYQINATSSELDPISYPLTSVSRCENVSFLMTFDLVGLHPYIDYTVAVRSRALESPYWSESALTRVLTDIDVPSRNPETRCSAYSSFNGSSGQRQITVFYRDIPAASKGGPITAVVMTHIVGANETRARRSTATVSHYCKRQERQCTADPLRHDANYTFVIQASTAAGFGPDVPTSTFTLNAANIGPTPPIYFVGEVLTANSVSSVNFTWQPADVTAVVDRYVIYYMACTVQCEGGLNWVTAGGDERTYSLTLPHAGHSIADYRFSIAAESGATSAGMLPWTTCLYKYDGGLPPINLVPIREQDPEKDTESLLVSWQPQVCKVTDGRIIQYILTVTALNRQGLPLMDGNATLVLTLDPWIVRWRITDLETGKAYNVKLSYRTHSNTYHSSPVRMVVATPEPPSLLVTAGIPVLVVIVIAIIGLVLCMRYGKLKKSLKPFAKPTIDEPIKYIADNHEEYLMPDLPSRASSSDGEYNEDGLLLYNKSDENVNVYPTYIMTYRPPVPERNVSLDTTRHSVDSNVTQQTNVSTSQSDAEDTHTAAPARPCASSAAHRAPGAGHLPITLVPVSENEEDSGYCRFGDPGEPNAFTVAMVHGPDNHPNLRREPFENERLKQQTLEKQGTEERDVSPDPDPDYSKVGLIYLPARTSTGSDRQLSQARPATPDDDGYLVPKEQSSPTPLPSDTLHAAAPDQRSDGYVVNNNLYGLESSPVTSDDDVFDDDDDDSWNGGEMNGKINLNSLCRQAQDDGYIPKPDVPLPAYKPRQTSPTLSENFCDSPVFPSSGFGPVSRAADQRATNANVPQQQQQQATMPQDSAARRPQPTMPSPSSPPPPAPPPPPPNGTIPANRPNSENLDPGYVSNDSLPKPKPSSESTTLSILGEGVVNDCEINHSPRITNGNCIRDSNVKSDSPRKEALDYVTIESYNRLDNDDVIMV